MHNVIVVLHLLLALGLVTLILLQRSEGGALGMGGGGGGGLMSGRGAGNVLSLATRWLGVGFFLTSITLTVLAGAQRGAQTVVDSVDPNALPSRVIEAPLEDDAIAPLIPTDDEAAASPDAIATPDAPAEDEPEASVIPLDDE